MVVRSGACKYLYYTNLRDKCLELTSPKPYYNESCFITTGQSERRIHPAVCLVFFRPATELWLDTDCEWVLPVLAFLLVLAAGAPFAVICGTFLFGWCVRSLWPVNTTFIQTPSDVQLETWSLVCFFLLMEVSRVWPWQCFCFGENGSDLESFTENKIFYILSLVFVWVIFISST